MKRLLIIAFILLFAGTSYAGTLQTKQAQVLAKKNATGYSLWYDNFTTSDTTIGIPGVGAQNFYAGGRNYTPSANKTIGKIGMRLTAYLDCTGRTYRFAIFNMDGTSLGSQVGGWSETISGNNSWNDTEITLSLTSDANIATTGSYAIVVQASESGFVGGVYVSGKASAGGDNGLRKFNADGTDADSSFGYALIRLYAR